MNRKNFERAKQELLCFKHAYDIKKSYEPDLPEFNDWLRCVCYNDSILAIAIGFELQEENPTIH